VVKAWYANCIVAIDSAISVNRFGLSACVYSICNVERIIICDEHLQ